MTNNEKIEYYIKIIYLYFSLNMSERVDIYINKCQKLIEDLKDDKLKAKYNICFAANQDYKKNF